MLDDREIKSLILHYQNNKDKDNTFNRIKEILSEYIYHFPAIAFDSYEEDDKGDFYLYISDRLEKILTEYQVQENCLFKTYFYLVLRRHYLNFIKSSTREKKWKTESIKEETVSYQDKNKEDENNDLEKVSLLLASLPPFYRLILKLRCPDFLSPEDFLEIEKYFHLKPGEMIEKLNIILEDIREKEQKRIQFLSAKTKSPKNPYRFFPIASPQAIAKMLNIYPRQVSKWLFEIKKIAQQKIGEAYVP